MIGHIVTILAAALSAFGSAWYGSKKALERYQERQGFRVRLEWYRETIQRLLEVEFALTKALMAFENDDADAVGEHLDEVMEKLYPTLRMTHQARSFATQSSIDQLQEAQEMIESLPEERQDPDDLRKVTERLRDAFKKSVRRLSDDVRDHLGLEEVEFRK